MAVDQRGDQRLLTRKVLVDGSDADASRFCNAIGARPVVAPLDQNASSSGHQDIHHAPRSRLTGTFPGRGSQTSHGPGRVATRVDASNCSRYILIMSDMKTSTWVRS